jgi:GTP cyclohydrolase I
MKMRGVRNDSSIMTIAYRGTMSQKDMREHVLAMIKNPKSDLRSV